MMLTHHYNPSSALAFSSSHRSNHGRLRPLPFDAESRSEVDDAQLGGLSLRRNILVLIASAVTFTSPSLSLAISAADLSAITPSSVTEFGLKPATEDKPQISLTGRSMQSMKSKSREPILQGLVYFPERAPSNKDSTDTAPSVQLERKQLDYYSDVLVLSAVSATDQDGPILAGAKFPVSSVRFPFSFQMFEENILKGRPGIVDAWENVVDTGDIAVRAQICPGDASAFPCPVNERKKYAEGVAKLISNLPGLQEGEQIRAPASLALE